MEKNPENRFQSADAFRTTLNSVRSSPSTSATTQDISAVSAPAMVPSNAATAQPATSFFGSEPVAPASPPVAEAAPMVQTPLPSVGNYHTEFSPSPNASHRGLYMALGALVVLVGLVAAGLYVPRRMKAKAAQDTGVVAPPEQTPAQSSPTQSVPVEAPPLSTEQNVAANPSPAAPAADSTLTPSTEPPSVPKNTRPVSADSSNKAIDAPLASIPGHASHRANPKAPLGTEAGSAKTAIDSAGGSGTVADEKAETVAKWEELERQLDQLSSRANAASSSLDTLQREQASQGLNLRGDIAASQERLHTYTAKAQAAMHNQDAKNTEKYLSLAQSELETIEKFLGH
jgi:eukaryotic-like serine/threonine-protein kinase